jgi:hypothetical protein
MFYVSYIPTVQYSDACMLHSQDNAAEMQLLMGQYIAFFERVKNLLNWTHPYKTLLVFIFTIITTIVCRLIPFRYLLRVLKYHNHMCLLTLPTAAMQVHWPCCRSVPLFGPIPKICAPTATRRQDVGPVPAFVGHAADR